MAEEFIDDIIGSAEASKTEAGMAAEIQGSDATKSSEKQAKTDAADVTMGSEATPDVVQDDKGKAPETDAIKDLAAQLGWREDHTGDDAVDAATYILRSKDIQKSMSQYNKDLKNQLQDLNGSVSALKEHNDSVYKSELKRLEGEVASLKKERRDAIELADVDKVEELDKQIDDLNKDINKPKPVDKPKQTTTDNPAYDEWVKDNQWYLADDDMAKFADTIAQQYVGAPLDRVYAIVRSKVQEVFPDKFESVKAADPVKTPMGPKSPVERSSAKGNNINSFTKADLTSDQLQIMNQFVRGGIMTEEAYINDIAKMQQ